MSGLNRVGHASGQLRPRAQILTEADAPVEMIDVAWNAILSVVYNDGSHF